MKAKKCLCYTPGVYPHEHALSGDENVQFLLLDQFLSNYKG